MTWTEITVVCKSEPDDWSPMIEVLRDYGCENSLQQDRPPALIACLADLPGTDGMLAQMRARLMELGVQEVLTRQVPDVDWSEIWKVHFKPRRVGKHFVIKPTWESWEGEASDLIIELDPGQAFGTGEHPTTRGCLELMETLDLEGKRVLDLGCGSGVLAIGAKLLGASEVSGIDIEPVSVEVAKLNAATNGLTIPFKVGTGLEENLPQPYDAILSNIVSATLIALSFKVSQALVPGGTWLVSGILEPNWQDVKAAAERVGFVLQKDLMEDQWVSAIFQR